MRELTSQRKWPDPNYSIIIRDPTRQSRARPTAIHSSSFIISKRNRGRVHLLIRVRSSELFPAYRRRLTANGHIPLSSPSAQQVSHVMMSWRVPFRSMGSPDDPSDLTICQPMVKEGPRPDTGLLCAYYAANKSCVSPRGIKRARSTPFPLLICQD